MWLLTNLDGIVFVMPMKFKGSCTDEDEEAIICLFYSFSFVLSLLSPSLVRGRRREKRGREVAPFTFIRGRIFIYFKNIWYDGREVNVHLVG